MSRITHGMKRSVVISAEEQSAWDDVLLHATEATRIRCSDFDKAVANLKATQDALGRLLEILN